MEKLSDAPEVLCLQGFSASDLIFFCWKSA